jgi:hypothetical protein
MLSKNSIAKKAENVTVPNCNIFLHRDPFNYDCFKLTIKQP